MPLPIWGAHPGMDVAALSRCYGIRGVIDYGEDRPGDGIMLGIGAGMMMAAMDAVPTCRWAVDVSGDKAGPSYHCESWAQALPWVVSHVCVAAWFSISSPDGFVRTFLDPLPQQLVACYSHPELERGLTVCSLPQLAVASAVLERAATTRAARGVVPPDPLR